LLRCAITRQSSSYGPNTLNSWKEIANYLDRGVRTVQRWERELHLPVHRIGTGKRSPVYANIAELKFWLNTSGAQRELRLSEKPGPRLITRHDTRTIEDSHRLLLAMREMAQKIAENSVRQRRQAEDLESRILQMRAKVRRG
jgi:hypothetical protein